MGLSFKPNPINIKVSVQMEHNPKSVGRIPYTDYGSRLMVHGPRLNVNKIANLQSQIL
jgi:hypothetical protein